MLKNIFKLEKNAMKIQLPQWSIGYYASLRRICPWFESWAGRNICMCIYSTCPWHLRYRVFLGL